VAARVHRERVALWRDALLLAAHARAPDGAHRRVVDPAHFAPQFPRKPRAQVMLYRDSLVQLGEAARWYVSELSRRRRAQLREEVLGVYALLEEHGAPRLLQAMAFATTRSAYGAEYLAALLAFEGPLPGWSAASPAGPPPDRAGEAAAVGPPQAEVDRHLSLYEAYVRTD
jgi:hypothetical protein